MNRLLFLLLTLLFNPVLSFAQLTAEDHLSMTNIKDVQVYDSLIVYTKTTKEEWNASNQSSIWITDVNGQNHRQLTEGGYDYDPKWSPDGSHVAFVSYRDNLQQIYAISKSGGDLVKVSDAQSYISNYQWLNEQQIAYVDDEPRDSLLVAKEQENGGGYFYDTHYYTNALWLFDTKTGTRRKVTDGSFRIIEFDLSSDGKRLAYVAAKNYDSYEAIVNSWVEVVDMETEQSLYKYNEAKSLSSVNFSPDGRHLSFVGNTMGFAANDGLFLANLASGKTQNLTFDFDPTIQKTQWLNDETISFLTPRNGYTGIYQADLEGKINQLLNPHWVVYEYQIQGENLFFSAASGTKTKQLYRQPIKQEPVNQNLSNADLRDQQRRLATPLTQLNTRLAKKIKTTTGLLNYKSYDGTEVQGIVTYPPGYHSDNNYPLMVIPHGGPDALVMDDFNWMGQFFADNGYVVFQPNFRGSIGYGRDFYAGNRNAFGKTDFEDIMAGVDELVSARVADPDKLVIGGWSYGGYMANWAITKTNRFKAAISVAGMSNLVSLYGQHEFSNRAIGIWEYKARPIDNLENYRKASPIFYVEKAQTPLLILHGERDTRSPTLQAMEMYRAMKDAGKTVEMMLYPRAGHSISNPVQFKSVLTNWLTWANQYVND